MHHHAKFLPKVVEQLQRYSDLTVFKKVTVRHLDL